MAADQTTLDTIWEVPDPWWREIEPILLQDAPLKETGRPSIDLRNAFNGVIFRLRSGCQWAKLPSAFGKKSSLHRWFQRWCERGVMELACALLWYRRLVR